MPYAILPTLWCCMCDRLIDCRSVCRCALIEGVELVREVAEGSVSCCSAGSRRTVSRPENGKALGEEIDLLAID